MRVGQSARLTRLGLLFLSSPDEGVSDELPFRTALSVARNYADIGPVSCRSLYETLA